MANPVIIAAIAWHISTMDQFEDCFNGFGSFTTAQTLAPQAFLLSWSAPPKLYDIVIKQLSDYMDNLHVQMSNTRFVFLNHKGKLKQFEHYKKIDDTIKVLNLAELDNTWMIFGDADDAWAPSRIQFMTSVQCNNPAMSVLLFHWFAIHTEETKSTIIMGTVRGSFEYWMCFTRYAVFAAFFSPVSAEYLQSMFCDLAFDAHLLNEGGRFLFVPNPYDLCKNNHLYIKYGDGHKKQLAGQSARLGCVQWVEMKVMRNFPNELTPWSVWGEQVDTYTQPQLFTLNQTVNASQLKDLRDRGNDVVIFNQTFKAICCNEFCRSATNAHYPLITCRTCGVPKYCCTGCQDADFNLRHAQVCASYVAIRSNFFDVDVFSEKFTPHHPPVYT